ncbi:MAG: hypothetical protein O3B86_14355, partial [Planctomycetota bacterium]|nr:hypothetical protein [Planctomycetota bacterium]
MHPHSSAPEARYQLAPQVYLAWCIFVVWGLPMPSPAVAGLIVSPTSVVLDSPQASQQLIVSL